MTDRPDRGQLILIGAISIALVVVGIGLVVNAVLFTENVRPSQSTAQLNQAEEIDFEVSRSVRSLGIRVNHRSRNHTREEIATWLDDNVTTMSHLFEESYLGSGPIAVNVTNNASAGHNGSRLVQAGDATFEYGGSDWRPVRAAGDDQRLGWAVVNFNATRSGDGRFHANFTNPDGDVLNMTFNKTYGPTQFEVITSVNGGAKTTSECLPHYDRVLLSLHGGRSFTDESCAFDATTDIGNVSEVHFEGADNVVGKYSLVAREDDPGDLGLTDQCEDDPSDPVDEPCLSPVVWRANVTVGVSGNGFDYDRTHEVDVYPGGS